MQELQCCTAVLFGWQTVLQYWLWEVAKADKGDIEVVPMGIDATHKGPAEGTRPWPEEIEMSAEIKAQVARRWQEYGIPTNK